MDSCSDHLQAHVTCLSEGLFILLWVSAELAPTPYFCAAAESSVARLAPGQGFSSLADVISPCSAGSMIHPAGSLGSVQF